MKLLTKKNLLIAAVILIVAVTLGNLSFADKLVQPKVPMQKLLAKLTNHTRQVKKQWQVPGVAVAVVQGDKIIYAKGFGKRNAKGQPVTPNTIFDIASLTKSFTAVMLGRQIERGKYHWNTKVLSLDPGFKLYSPKATRKFEIRDLVAHDSGLPAGALDALGNFGYSTQHTLHALRYVKPVAPFRTEFAYQDVFLAIAKKIIEQASGQSYTSAINQWIFQPLNMTRSFIRTEPALQKAHNVAQPFLLSYSLKNHPYAPSSPYLSKKWALDIGLAGGGIHSTAVDIGKWLIFNMNNGVYQRQRLLSKQTMQFIHSPKTIIQRTQSGKVSLAYGEGWYIDKQAYQPYTMLYHSGGGTGMHALMSYIPQAKLGIVVLTNQYTNSVPTVLTRWFFDMFLYGKPMKNWNKIYLKQRSEAIKRAVKAKGSDHCHPSSKTNLSKYSGTYYNPVYGHLIIAQQGEKLSLTIGPQNIKWQLTTCKKHTLQAFWPNPNGMSVPMLEPGQDLVHFRVSPSGQVRAMTIPFLNNTNNGTFTKEE